MSRGPDYLYELLPYVHRRADAGAGYGLRALLRVIGEQVNVIEDDIAQLYENAFIETCEDWVVPYIGDLLGVTGASRAEVAATVALRRRKGTLALLEVLARDVADWPARAVEFYALLGWTQHLRHVHLERGRTVNLRDGEAMDLLGGPFERTAHAIDIRRVASARRQGRYHISAVGLFIWRLQSYSVTRTPACCLENIGEHCYTFSVLGNDTPLFAAPVAESDPSHIAEEINLPVPIRRRAFARDTAAWYGEIASLSIHVKDWPEDGKSGIVPLEAIVAADLSDWHARRAPRGKVLVDPVLGRLEFAPEELPRSVTVRYRYGFSTDIGGGEYRRALSQPKGASLYRVRGADTGPGEFESVAQALAQWNADKDNRQVRAAVIEIADSGVYEERIAIDLGAGEYLQLRAANRTRPVLRLLDYRNDQRDPFAVRGKAGSRFVIDGLLLSGRGIEVADAGGDLCDVSIRHCTLVPGWELDCDCEPLRVRPSITLRYTGTTVRIEHSIVGGVRVIADEKRNDPSTLTISDSIVDATSVNAAAIADEDGRHAFVSLNAARCTVIGAVRVHAVGLAENTIFTAPLLVARRQHGCVRFCALAPLSRTPQRFHCQDTLAARFNSLRYGTPAYCQLAFDCPVEIARGADDESELGAFHDLFQPQRADSLRVRLDEYTPAGADAGIIFEN